MNVVPLRRIGPVIALVCALHSLLLGWGASWRVGVDIQVPHAPAMSTRWVAAPLVQEPVLTPVTRVPDRGPARRVQRSLETSAQPAAAPQITQAEAPPTQSAEPSATEPAWPADAVQRAVRESARQKGLAARVDEQLGNAPADAQSMLRNGIASGARSDCLKGGEGGYANANMGLFALPLLAVDAATGRCR